MDPRGRVIPLFVSGMLPVCHPAIHEDNADHSFAAKLSQSGIKPARAVSIAAAAFLTWLTVATPEGLDDRAWNLFLVFISTIGLIIAGAMPIFVAAIAALAVTVLSRILTPQQAFVGFSEPAILLIATAFLIARGVVKSGLGERVAYLLIGKLGKTTLGLGYAMVTTDLLIAPAFPSNTARSGVLFPVIESLALGTGSAPDESTRKKTGAFLMMLSITGLSISSGLWLTAMAANPIGAEMAKEQGIDITFGSWLLAASVPSLAAFATVPYVLYRLFPPEVLRTPGALEIAKERLTHMGPVQGREWVMVATFIGLVVFWSLSDWLDISTTAIAFAGLFVLMISGIFSVRDLGAEGRAFEVFIWFAILYTLSSSLNDLGFMSWLGGHISTAVAGYSWPVSYALLLTSYVLIHYLFVSQTAHLMALFPVFLSVGMSAGVPGALMAYMLLFATNFFSCITPQASSGNVIFVGSGYLTTGEVYRYGGVVTAANLVVYGVVGPLWILSVF